ncbi:MAG TPA: DinB family protein [Gemmatimonadaceae bacterium]|nr:DinB family protein [Gemmatimonadaceae bacterium]
MDFSLDDAIPVLERTPATLRALLDGLPDDWTRRNEGEGTWSPFDVVGHLIHGERTDWIPRARIILAPDGPATAAAGSRAFVPFDRFAQMRMPADEPLGARLETFARLRAEGVAALRGFHLTPADLERRGVHPEFGPVTLRQLLATWVAHDLGHVSQVVRTMARQYTAEAGPWVAYLKILQK